MKGKTIKYILRKNGTFQEGGELSILSPIQIIDVFDSFKEIKKEFYKRNIETSDLFNANGENILGLNDKAFYKRLLFRNVYKNGDALDEIIKSHSNLSTFGYEWLWTIIDNEDDMELFNLILPLNIFEILITTNDYLYYPVWNNDFFVRQDIPIPNQNEIIINNKKNFLVLGLYVDELDFWTSQDCPYCNFNRYNFNVNIFNKEIIDINDDKWKNNYTYEIKNNSISLKEQEFTPFNLAEFNRSLKTPFIEFKKIKLDEISSFQRKVFSKKIIDLLKENYSGDSIDAIIDYILENNLDLSHLSNLSAGLTVDFIKEIIQEHKLSFNK